MKSAIFKLTSLLISILFISTISTVFAQSKFKVVCDKTDKTMKIVETENRSPNYVPIKGGFPFRQVAQKWIDENYTTTSCNPEQIIEQNKQQENKPTPTSNISSTTQSPISSSTPAHTPLQPRRSGSNSAIKYRNTSFLANARFSNMGEAFMLSEKLMYGFELGIEQLFGKQIYFGTGINMDFYFSDFDGTGSLDDGKETIYFF